MKQRRINATFIIAALALAILVLTALPLAGTAAPRLERQPSESLVQSPDTTTHVSAALRSSPVMFIENVGQFADGARFQVRGGMGTMWLADDAIWMTVLEKPSSPQPPSPNLGEGGAFLPSPEFGRGAGGEGQPRKGVNLRLTFPGANPHPRMEPFDRLDTVVSYFIGNDSDRWHPDVPVWGGVRYKDLYPGVDLEITSEAGRWAWRMVARDASPLEGRGVGGEAVRLRVEGADAVTLDGDALRLTTAVGGLTLPLLTVEGAMPNGQPGIFNVEPGTFEVSSPFSSVPLLSRTSTPSLSLSLQDNPDDLLYSTFLGGSSDDYGLAIAVDGAGSAYVMGYTYSSDFPTTAGAFDTSYNGGRDAFVVKMNAAGTGLAYATFLGGSGDDSGRGIAVDGAGSAYVVGHTKSSDFSTTPGAFDTSYNGYPGDAFVVKLNASGTALAYATFLGGSGSDSGQGIAVDGAGNAYVTGLTGSSNFPATAGAFDTSYNGGYDAFVVKVNTAGTGLVYATFLGGSDWDRGFVTAVDGAGSAYVTGLTYSSDFPTTAGAFDSSYNGHHDAFVVKMNAAGTALAYATFLGGSDCDWGLAMAVDAAGSAYVTGYTSSSDFPTTPGAFDTTYNGGWDAFVVKVNAGGTDLAYATRLGGSGIDYGEAIAVDGAGSAYVTGGTSSSDFPTTVGAYDTSYNGRTDAFVAKLAVGGGVRYDKPPIVFVHGWQGLATGTRRCSEGVKLLAPGVAHTFGEMAQWFVDADYDVWIANLDTGPLYTPPIEENAQCLKNQIASVRLQTGQKVILVAHSMGGLVSRACLNLNGCRDNVAALYTLGSPHAGINSAFLLKLLTYFKAPVAEELICEWQPALCQFTTDGMLWFNLFNPNRDGATYSFIGGTKTPFPLGWLLLPFDGRNDGMVGSYSAVGWLYPTKLNVVLGPAASRYWTNETHSSGVGHPSYFEASGGPESQAFRCIAWGDCTEATTLALSVAQMEPALSATTVDVVGHLAMGQSVTHTLQVDTSDHSLFYLSWLTGTLSFTLTQPDGQVITPAYADAHLDVVTYTTGLGDYAMPPFAAYAFTTTVPGLYTTTITAGDVGITGTDYLLFAALETTRTFSVSTDTNLYQVGQTATFTGTLQGPWGGITGATVQVTLIRSDGVTETLRFNDLGSGFYTATWMIPDAPGYLQATFTAVGDDSGTAFTRQVDDLLAIAPYAAQLADTYADWPEDRDGDGFDDILALDVGVMATQVGTYTLSADLVASGQTVAHALEYTVLATGTQTVTLGFDGWDIRRSRVDGPYTVTQVSLVDLGVGGIPAQIADDVWVTAAYDWQDFGFESLYLPLILRNL